MSTSRPALDYLEARLRRKTSQSNWIREVDGLRFLAIFAVMVTHVFGFMTRPEIDYQNVPGGKAGEVLGTAGRGVELFFVISGFILAMPFVKRYLYDGREIDKRAYYWRRVTRLEPPYFVIMTTLFAGRAIAAAAGLSFEARSVAELTKSFFASLIYGHWILLGERPFLNVIAWSLEVEIQYYLISPFLSAGVFRLPKNVRSVALVVLVCSAPFIQSAAGLSSNTLLGQYQYFLLGVILAEAYLSGFQIKIASVGNVALSTLLFVGLFWIPIRGEGPTNQLVFSLMILTFYVMVLSPGPTRSLLAARPLALMGGMVYSIYLIHFQMIEVAGLITTRFRFSSFWLNLAVQVGALFGLTLIASAVFFVLVERPCMDPAWVRKLRRNRLPADKVEAADI